MRFLICTQHRMWRNSSPKEDCRRADSSVSKTRLQLRLLFWFWHVRIHIEESTQYELSVRLTLSRNKTASQTRHPLCFLKCMAYFVSLGRRPVNNPLDINPHHVRCLMSRSVRLLNPARRTHNPGSRLPLHLVLLPSRPLQHLARNKSSAAAATR